MANYNKNYLEPLRNPMTVYTYYYQIGFKADPNNRAKRKDLLDMSKAYKNLTP
jgi:hypothetical protein